MQEDLVEDLVRLVLFVTVRLFLTHASFRASSYLHIQQDLVIRDERKPRLKKSQAKAPLPSKSHHILRTLESYSWRLSFIAMQCCANFQFFNVFDQLQGLHVVPDISWSWFNNISILQDKFFLLESGKYWISIGRVIMLAVLKSQQQCRHSTASQSSKFIQCMSFRKYAVPLDVLNLETRTNSVKIQLMQCRKLRVAKKLTLVGSPSAMSKSTARHSCQSV